MTTPTTESATAGAPSTTPADADGPAALRPGIRAGAVSAGPALVLMAFGLVLVGQAAAGARSEDAGAVDQVLYVAGLLLVLLPAVAGALLPRVAGSTRVVLALGAIVLLQVARLVVDPSSFAEVSGLVQLEGLRSIEQTGTLYADNVLAPLTSYYPGLQVVTDAVGSLTGLDAHLSGVTVLVAARLLTALAILLVVAWVTGSTRVGAAAVVLYALDPELPVVGATFDSPTLALGLALLAVHLLVTRRPGSALGVLPAVLAVWAVVATHHVTAVVLVVGLAVWAVVEAVMRRGRLASAGAIGLTALAGVAGLVVTLANPAGSGNPADPLVGGDTSDASSGIVATADALRGTTWEWPLVVVSLVLSLVALLLALACARGLLRLRSSLVVVLLVAAVGFLVVPVGVLTTSLADTVDVAAGVVYLGFALVVAWAWWATAPRADKPAQVRAGVATIGVGVVFVGSLVLGSGPLAGQLPGPFRVGDGTRSIDPVNTAAADWINDQLPAGSRVYGDRATGLLLRTTGDQVVVRREEGGVDASPLLLDPDVGEDDVALVRESGIRYLVADRRNAEGLPAQGYYAEPGEAGADDRTEPVPEAALRKFSAVPGVDVVYDDGVIVIYDLVGLGGEPDDD